MSPVSGSYRHLHLLRRYIRSILFYDTRTLPHKRIIKTNVRYIFKLSLIIVIWMDDYRSMTTTNNHRYLLCNCCVSNAHNIDTCKLQISIRRAPWHRHRASAAQVLRRRCIQDLPAVSETTSATIKWHLKRLDHPFRERVPERHGDGRMGFPGVFRVQ